MLLEQFRAFSGAAFQTTEQRQWIDLQRLIARQRPSKRPKVKPGDPLRAWCYERATRKHGWWSRLLTFLYVGNIVVMATQRFQDSASAEQTRDIVYIGLTACYALDIVIRLAGLGWRAYKDNWWNLYDLVVVTGTFATTIPLLAPDRDTATGIVQAQKLFLVAIAFKLVQKSNALNQLFRTAVASLPAIGSTFALWLVLFITFAIVNVEVFGLTRWGANETYAKNFSTFFGSLVFLSMTSTGEGWNQYMHDYMVEPPNCTPASNYLETDCGSKSWALALFIAWNVISKLRARRLARCCSRPCQACTSSLTCSLDRSSKTFPTSSSSAASPCCRASSCVRTRRSGPSSTPRARATWRATRSCRC